MRGEGRGTWSKGTNLCEIVRLLFPPDHCLAQNGGQIVLINQ